MSTHEELPIGPNPCSECGGEYGEHVAGCSFVSSTGSALPKVWPEVPWPKNVWPTTIEEAGKLLRAKLGDNDTTAISGTLMRHGWQCAEQAFKTLLEENGFSAPNDGDQRPRDQESNL